MVEQTTEDPRSLTFLSFPSLHVALCMQDRDPYAASYYGRK